MRVEQLSLYDFRNYSRLQLNFDPGVNLIQGENAQGKTNLLEAIVYLGSGRSWRTQKTGELIRFGADFADLQAGVASQQRQQSIRWLLFPGRPRQLFRNGAKKKTAADIAGMLNTVLFCPEDLTVLKAGSAGRRRLTDQALCQLRPHYEAALGEYQRILEQKTRILKDREENPGLLEILPEYNTRLCRVGALLISYRARFLNSMAELAEEYHRSFSGGKEEFLLEYQTVSTVTDPFAEVSVLEGQLMDHLQSHSRAELAACQCLTGPHKDDFSVTLSGVELKAFGSQGQVRTATISLKLAQRALLERSTGELPVLLLDDVLSELDPRRQDFVLNQIAGGQVFITCCEPEKFTKLGQTITISNGTVGN